MGILLLVLLMMVLLLEGGRGEHDGRVRVGPGERVLVNVQT